MQRVHMSLARIGRITTSGFKLPQTMLRQVVRTRAVVLRSSIAPPCMNTSVLLLRRLLGLDFLAPSSRMYTGAMSFNTFAWMEMQRKSLSTLTRRDSRPIVCNLDFIWTFNLSIMRYQAALIAMVWTELAAIFGGCVRVRTALSSPTVQYADRTLDACPSSSCPGGVYSGRESLVPFIHSTATSHRICIHASPSGMCLICFHQIL